LVEEACQMAHGVEVGAIFVYAWGYDQRNVNFFQVVGVTEKTVTVRAIEAEAVPDTEGFMCDKCVPKPGVFKADSEPSRKLVRDDGTLHFDFGTGRPWDGKPEERSWYA